MARRSQGERIQPAVSFALEQQAKGDVTAATGLREYRAQGGTIRTQDWYRIWRGLPLAPPKPGDRKEPPRPGQQPRDWITNTSVVYYDPQKQDFTHPFWHRIYSGGRKRISDEEAMQRSIDEGDSVARKYGWVAVLVYVTSYQAVYQR